MYRTILVPLDGSPFAEHALPLALAIAGRAGATLRLVLVHAPVALPHDGSEMIYDAALDGSLRDQEVDYLAHLAKRLADLSRLEVKHRVIDGPIAEMIHGEATATQADLVVMTTHGRGPFNRLWLGSIADQLVRRLPARLLLVRPGDGLPNLAQPPLVRNMLIALDGSEFAEQIIEPATALGALLGAEYTLVRVINPVPHFAARFAGHGVVAYGKDLEQRLGDFQGQLRSAAETYLDRVAAALQTRSLKVRTQVLDSDQPAAALLSLAASLPADVIALKTHGRHGVGRLLLGSVADKVVRGAAVPVLL